MILYTNGDGKFVEVDWQRSPIKNDEIAVKAVFTGVCRSDIDMMMGKFGPLPIDMSGHEGLAQVIEVGSSIKNVAIGDYVAVHGHGGAYADEYNVNVNNYINVPAPEPKYILEPVACGINVILQAEELISKKCGKGSRALIIGSGFLAWVAYNTIRILGLNLEVSVLGSSNKEIWGDLLTNEITGDFDVIIDLVGKNITNIRNGAVIINGVAKATSKEEEEQLLWKACTSVRPSPRTYLFHKSMLLARELISTDLLNVDNFWTKRYDRKTEWGQAFEDGLNRPANYSRGYISWL
jgi:D-arabinose 1-dehydrogenase-like Zn-dependent alcohol dehydrogenase